MGMVYLKIAQLKGVGPKKEKILKEMDLHYIDDLLYFFPRKYIDKTKIADLKFHKSGNDGVVSGTIIDIKVKKNYGKKDIMTIKVESQGFIGEILFFNAHYLKNKIKFQKEYFFYGKIEIKGKLFKMIHPEIEESEKKDFLIIEPVYSLPMGLGQKNIRDFIKQSLVFRIYENLPEYFINKNKLCSREHALNNIHFPESRINFKEAKYRLIYEEFFKFIFGNQLIKEENFHQEGIVLKEYKEKTAEFIAKLPFKLTNDQTMVLGEIFKDLNADRPMRRLLQGDVGSGKTVVAIIASYITYLNGFQTAVMVPTEILAMQHYNNFKKLLPENLKIKILTSSVQNKNEINQEISDGEVDIVIGTHALIQESVKFNKLGLIVTDEQHRFGVNQRKSLMNKNEKANYLMMSATPIPRTMSLVMYSDIYVSTIEELPTGRKPIKTEIVRSGQLKNLYAKIKAKLENDEQGYIVYPLIEDSENFEDVKSIKVGYEEIKGVFKDYKLAIVHGQMKFEEREKILLGFKNRDYDILISTTVIEVGIDVSNASFILIHNAERFGLSQLHQLRGRVGRGNLESHCFLISNSNHERLQALVKSNDGFFIAKKDLEIRGPGEVLGIKQHGTNHFLIADMFKHLGIMELAVKDVLELFEKRDEFTKYIEKYAKEILV
jgi:ATP-dependent DNA helicase RecG